MVHQGNLLIPPQTLDAHDAFDVEPPELLFHYTTIGGAYGILSSDSIWMTKVRYLNDTSELEIGMGTFRELLEAYIERKGDTAEAGLLDEVRQGLDTYSGANICVTSFCEHPDLLSQWRWYGGGGTGVSLGVRSSALRAVARGPIRLWKCVYDEAAHRELLNALVQRFLRVYRERRERDDPLPKAAREELLAGFFQSFLQIAPLIKNPHFAEEREWRLVTLPVEIDDEAYDVCLVGDRIIQRYELKLPRDEQGWCRAFGRIVVGPAKDPALIGEAVGLLCRKNHIDCPSIGYSAIPFRAR